MRKLLTLARTSAAMVALVVVAVGCSRGAQWNAPGETTQAAKVTVTSPANGATDVETSAEIQFRAEGTKDVSVTLKDDAGDDVPGQLLSDGVWLPNAQLDWNSKYSATITASKSDGTKSEAKSSFTTMAKPDGGLVRVSSDVDGGPFGIGMPIVLHFGVNVPQNKRAEVQKRLFVTSDPPQEGIWHWIDSPGITDAGSEVHFRPKVYWKPGTKIHVRVALGGLPWGVEGKYGANDLTLDVKIGAHATTIAVDNATKTLTVTQDGQVLRTMPVSLGRPDYPSSSGTMLIFLKAQVEQFTSASIDIPPNAPGGYSTPVEWVMKLTQRGEYIHAAPWSVADQGRRNVSHGCVNLSTPNAMWLEQLVDIGTPVTVTGTEVHVKWNNGLTDWDRSWEEYVKGSAIPYQPPAPAATPSS